jgi:hypothetical protein
MQYLNTTCLAHTLHSATQSNACPQLQPPLRPHAPCCVLFVVLLCRYQKSYRELAKKHPGFRERSETTELIVEISLQPWNSFKPDGVILFRCVHVTVCVTQCACERASLWLW